MLKVYSRFLFYKNEILSHRATSTYVFLFEYYDYVEYGTVPTYA
jgi:hypothetical protein